MTSPASNFFTGSFSASLAIEGAKDPKEENTIVTLNRILGNDESLTALASRLLPNSDSLARSVALLGTRTTPPLAIDYTAARIVEIQARDLTQLTKELAETKATLKLFVESDITATARIKSTEQTLANALAWVIKLRGDLQTQKETADAYIKSKEEVISNQEALISQVVNQVKTQMENNVLMSLQLLKKLRANVQAQIDQMNEYEKQLAKAATTLKTTKATLQTDRDAQITTRNIAITALAFVSAVATPIIWALSARNTRCMIEASAPVSAPLVEVPAGIFGGYFSPETPAVELPAEPLSWEDCFWGKS